MIKIVTAHPRIITAVIVGTTVLSITSFSGVNLLDAAQGLGGGMSRAYNWLKAAGVVGVVGAIMFFVIRFDILGLKMPPENSGFMVARRGRVVMYKETGCVVLYESGRNRIHVANYRCLVPVHFGDRFVSLGTHEFTLDGVTYKVEFTLKWRILKDMFRLKRIVTEVSDSNWWDGKFNQLTDAVKESASGTLAELLRSATLSEVDGTPVINQDLAKSLINGKLDGYCCSYAELIVMPISRTDAQQGKDGSLAIAEAIRSHGWLRRLVRRLLKR